jgi:hypothetical protein
MFGARRWNRTIAKSLPKTCAATSTIPAWSPEGESNTHIAPSEGTCRVHRPGEIGAPRVNRTPRTCVRSAGTVSNGRGIGPPPWCRTRPLQPVRPLSRVYKAQPLAGAMEEIGSRGWSRTSCRLAYETSNLPLIYPAKLVPPEVLEPSSHPLQGCATPSQL